MYLMKAKHLACQADIAVADICKTALVLTCLWAGVTIAVLPPGQVSIGDSSLFSTVRDRVRKTHLKPKASAGVSSQSERGAAGSGAHSEGCEFRCDSRRAPATSI